MFRDASQRRFDVLLFWALDRLSREGVLQRSNISIDSRPTASATGASPSSILILAESSKTR
jgi:hypothetical protein